MPNAASSSAASLALESRGVARRRRRILITPGVGGLAARGSIRAAGRASSTGLIARSSSWHHDFVSGCVDNSVVKTREDG